MVAFITSVLILMAMLAVLLRVARKRPPGTPLTWGEAFVAGIWVFLMMVLAYGVVPNQWLVWADNQLGWRPDIKGIPTGLIGHVSIFGKTIISHHKLFGGPHDLSLLAFAGKNRGKISLNAQNLRDIIAIVIYGVMITGQIKLMLWWQKRKPAEAAEKSPVIRESAFGRPVAQES